MKKYIISILLLCLATAQAEDKQFNQYGISFKYSDELTLNAEVKGVPTIKIMDNKGIQMMIQDYGKATTPDKLSDILLSSLKNIFKQEMTILENKSVVRTLFGKKREGHYSIIVKNNIPMELVVFTFTHNGGTWCVMTQQPCKDMFRAEHYFTTIQKSLKTSE